MNNLSYDPIRCNIVVDHTLGESRLCFEGIEEKERDGKKGIRFHSNVTAFFLRLIGKKNIVDIKDVTGRVYHLNRESLSNWIRTNGADADHRFKAGADFSLVTERAMDGFLREIIKTKTENNPLSKRNADIAFVKNEIEQLESQKRIRDAANRPDNWSEGERELESEIEKRKWQLNMFENLPDKYLKY